VEEAQRGATTGLLHRANRQRQVADLDPGFVDFGELPLGQPPADRVLVLANIGDFVLDVEGLSLSGPAATDFEILAGQDSCSSAAVEPGNACGFSLRFDPTAPGVREATLRLDSNEPDGPRLYDVIGTRDVLFFGGFE